MTELTWDIKSVGLVMGRLSAARYNHQGSLALAARTALGPGPKSDPLVVGQADGAAVTRPRYLGGWMCVDGSERSVGTPFG